MENIASEKTIQVKKQTAKALIPLVVAIVYLSLYLWINDAGGVTLFNIYLSTIGVWFGTIGIVKRQVIYKITFKEDAMEIGLDLVCMDKVLIVPYEEVEVIYRTFQRKPKKNKINLRRRGNLIGFLWQRNGWPLRETVDEIEKHDKIKLKNVDMK